MLIQPKVLIVNRNVDKQDREIVNVFVEFLGARNIFGVPDLEVMDIKSDRYQFRIFDMKFGR